MTKLTKLRKNWDKIKTKFNKIAKINYEIDKIEKILGKFNNIDENDKN